MKWLNSSISALRAWAIDKRGPWPRLRSLLCYVNSKCRGLYTANDGKETRQGDSRENQLCSCSTGQEQLAFSLGSQPSTSFTQDHETTRLRRFCVVLFAIGWWEDLSNGVSAVQQKGNNYLNDFKLYHHWWYSLFHAPFNTLEHSTVQCSKELSASAAHPRGTHASSPCSCTVDPINWLAESVLWTVKARPIFFHTASTCRSLLWATVRDSSSKIRCWKLHETGCRACSRWDSYCLLGSKANFLLWNPSVNHGTTSKSLTN